jgi:hypothetical protein
MSKHFGGMSPLEEMGPNMAWRPPPVPLVRGQPRSFDASLATTLGITTPQTIGSMPLGGPTPRDKPRAIE